MTLHPRDLLSLTEQEFKALMSTKIAIRLSGGTTEEMQLVKQRHERYTRKTVITLDMVTKLSDKTLRNMLQEFNQYGGYDLWGAEEDKEITDRFRLIENTLIPTINS